MKLENIVIIGPVYPYKGGIAHYTGLLCRELRKKYHVDMISFKLQYPRFMYRKVQKDYKNDTFKVDDVKYWLNTINPFNWIHVALKIRHFKPDLVILQWWHPYFAPCYIMLNFFKKYKTLFLCHNVIPHERFPFDQLLTKFVLQKGDFFIVQSSQDEDDLESIKKSAKYIKTVHPTYNAFKIQNMSLKCARNILDISMDSKVLLFFGFIREYKGLDCLLDAMRFLIMEYEDIKLLIVGDFGKDKEKYLDQIYENKIEKNIQIYDDYIPDKEVEKFFACCDLVVLPYRSATQSGIVQIAYGFEKPVVVTNVGGLPEVVVDGETGYIVEPECPDKLADAIIKFFNSRDKIDFARNVRNESEKYSWSKMTDCIEYLYENNV